MSTTAVAVSAADDELVNAVPAEQDVAMLAYALWQARGCPDGSPEQDWFTAESELKAKTSAADEQQPIRSLSPASR